MKLPLLVLGTAFLAACSAEGDDIGSISDDVTVHPTGSSTLGTFTLVVPADLATGDHRVSLDLAPVPGGTATESPDTSKLAQGGSIRIAPGKYCLTVYSSVTNHASTLWTNDCEIEIPAGGTRTYALARVHLRADPVKALREQHTITGGVSTVRITGDSANGQAAGETVDLASAKALLTTKVEWTSSSPAGLDEAWPAVDTNVPEGGEVTLGVPTGNHIVKIGIGLERPTLPDAVSGGGMHWYWEGGPSYAGSFKYTQNAESDLAFFDREAGAAVFELGGIEKRFPISEGNHTAYGWAIEVADVVDTDNAGVQTTVRGAFSVYRVSDNKRLEWHDDRDHALSSFATNQSVHVWGNEKYRVHVDYVKNGIAKSYEETVKP